MYIYVNIHMHTYTHTHAYSANLKDKFNDREFFTVAELYFTHNWN